MLEARFHPQRSAEYLVVGHLVWQGHSERDSPTVEPASALTLESEPTAILSKVRYLITATAPGSFERLQILRSRFCVLRGSYPHDCKGSSLMPRHDADDMARLCRSELNMPETTAHLERAMAALVLIVVTTSAIMVACFWVAQRASEHRDDALAALASDMVRVAQAQVAAERMVVVGRVYLLTSEPEFLARAQAAGAKLEQTLQELQREVASTKDRDLLGPPLLSAANYQRRFEELVSYPAAGATPKALAESLRSRLLPARDRLEADLQELVLRRQQQQADIRESAGKWALRALRLMVMLGVLGPVVSVLTSFGVIAGLSQLDRARPRKQSTSRTSGARPLVKDSGPDSTASHHG